MQMALAGSWYQIFKVMQRGRFYLLGTPSNFRYNIGVKRSLWYLLLIVRTCWQKNGAIFFSDPPIRLQT